jgi:SAM-dependent methyltransferase
MDTCGVREPEACEQDEAVYDALWDQKWGDLQKFGPTSRHQRRIIAALLDPLQMESVLDVGCGEGSLLAFISSRYHCSRLAGLDLAESAIEQARRNCPTASYFVGAVSALPQEQPFDLVTCIDVLEHVEDDVGLIRDLVDISRRFVLCGTVQGAMRPGELEIGHVRNYHRGELQEKMVRAGLTPVRTVEWGFPFYSPLFRSMVAGSRSEPLSYGRYGMGRRLLCQALYDLFLLNSWRRGDKVFVLAERRSR